MVSWFSVNFWGEPNSCLTIYRQWTGETRQCRKDFLPSKDSNRKSDYNFQHYCKKEFDEKNLRERKHLKIKQLKVKPKVKILNRGKWLKKSSMRRKNPSPIQRLVVQKKCNNWGRLRHFLRCCKNSESPTQRTTGRHRFNDFWWVHAIEKLTESEGNSICNRTLFYEKVKDYLSIADCWIQVPL